MTQWADYSGGRPSGAALKSAGFSGVIRYVGLGSSGKRLAAGEYANLTSEGIQVLLVAEAGTTDAWNGYAAGVSNARAALNDARALGVPDSVGIAAAADAHAANQAQIDAAVQYARGFADVLGKSRAGFYGFSETLNAVHAANIVGWFWRCGSEPSAADKTWVHFWQRNAAPTTRTVSGVSCDINEQYNAIGNNMAGFDATDFTSLFYNNPIQKFGNFSQLLADVVVNVEGVPASVAAVKADVASVKTDVASVKAAVAALQVSGVDLDALAAKVAALAPAIDYNALAKAVNDDAARRLAS